MDSLKNTKGLSLQTAIVPPTAGCEPISDDANMVFLANGISTRALNDAFDTLVTSHAEKKKGHGKKASDLKALILWDSCFMFESVWNKDWKCTYKEEKNWTSSDVYHFKKFHNPLAEDSQPFTKPEMMMAAPNGIQATTWTQDGNCEKQSKSPNFQPYWCEDFGEVFSESGIGVIHHLSLIDTLADDELKMALPSLNMPKWDYHRLTAKLLKPSHDGTNVWDIKARNDYDRERLMNILDEYDIIAFDGGNPDMHRLGLSLAGASFRQKLRNKISDGSLLYIGRSAGAIISSKDTITFEPNPAMWYYFSFSKDSNIRDFWPLHNTDGHGMEGLNLIDCGIRPHFNEGWEPGVQGYVAANNRKIVRLRNDAGFFCTEGQCVSLASASANFPFVRFERQWMQDRWKSGERVLKQHTHDGSTRSLQYGTAVYALMVRLIFLRFKEFPCELERLKAFTVWQGPTLSSKCSTTENMVESSHSDAHEFDRDDKVFDHEHAEDNPASLKYEDATKDMMREQLRKFSEISSHKGSP